MDHLSDCNYLSLIPDNLQNYDFVVLRRTTLRKASTIVTTAVTTTMGVAETGADSVAITGATVPPPQPPVVEDEEIVWQRRETKTKRRCCLWCVGDARAVQLTKRSKKRRKKADEDGALVVHERVGMVFFLDDILRSSIGASTPVASMMANPMFFEFSSAYEKPRLRDRLTGVYKENGTALYALEDVLTNEYERCQKERNRGMGGSGGGDVISNKLEMFHRRLVLSDEQATQHDAIADSTYASRLYARLYNMRNVCARPASNQSLDQYINAYLGSESSFSALRQIARRTKRRNNDALVIETVQGVFVDILCSSGVIHLEQNTEPLVLFRIIDRLMENSHEKVVLKRVGSDNSISGNDDCFYTKTDVITLTQK